MAREDARARARGWVYWESYEEPRPAPVTAPWVRLRKDVPRCEGTRKFKFSRGDPNGVGGSGAYRRWG